jgi:hypothetical protein
VSGVEVRRKAVLYLHRLGPRGVFELLGELEREHNIGADIDRRLQRYRRLDRATLEALGADDLLLMPHIWVVS